MKDDFSIGIIVLLVIVAIAIFGGGKMTKNSGGIFSTPAQTQSESQAQKQADIQNQIQTAQNQVKDLEKQIAAQNDSKYKGVVKLQYVNRSSNAGSEYVVLYMSSSATTTVPITGWTLHSVPSGETVSVPTGTLLYFSGQTNLENTVVLSPGDTVYVITGTSPTGYSKVN